MTTTAAAVRFNQRENPLKRLIMPLLAFPRVPAPLIGWTRTIARCRRSMPGSAVSGHSTSDEASGRRADAVVCRSARPVVRPLCPARPFLERARPICTARSTSIVHAYA